MQIPVGILLDRYGAKILLTVGAVVMAVGQLIVALSTILAGAVIGRMLVGMGDSFTFISMIAMINGWYHGSKASKLQQYVASAGQLGQFLSAVPFWALLSSVGWTFGFSVMSAISLVVVALVIVFTADDDHRSEVRTKKAVSLKQATAQLVENVKHPGVRLSFWTHFITQPTTTSIQLLWAVPFLVTAQGQSHDFASFILTAMVVFGFITGPVIGYLCAKYPQHRSLVVYSVVIAIMLTWIWMSSFSSAIPAWLLVIMFLVISVGGPASMIAFDYSKDMVPKSKLGSANGFANVGGFLATFVMMYLVGLVIDIVHSGSGVEERYTIPAFQIGFLAQLIVVAIGLIFFTLELGKLKAYQAKLGKK